MNERQTVITINKVADVQGRRGPQYEIYCRWPWTPGGAKHDDRIWIDSDQVAERPTPGQHNVVVTQGALKDDKLDGQMDWMYKWNVVRFGGDGQDQSDSHREANGDKYRTKEELRWTEAYHMASRMASAQLNTWPSDGASELEQWVDAWADKFYHRLALHDASAQAEAPAPAPTQVTTPHTVPNPPIQPAPDFKDPVAHIAQALNAYNASVERQHKLLGDTLSRYIRDTWYIEHEKTLSWQQRVKLMPREDVAALAKRIANGKVD